MPIELIPLKGSTELPECFCTRCQKKLDQASAADHENLPGPGDISICLYCGHVMTYGEDMRSRDLTPQELSELQRSTAWPQVKELQAKFKQASFAAVYDFRRKDSHH